MIRLFCWKYFFFVEGFISKSMAFALAATHTKNWIHLPVRQIFHLLMPAEKRMNEIIVLSLLQIAFKKTHTDMLASFLQGQ